MARKWADGRHHPCHMGGSQCFKAGDKMNTGPQMGQLATTPLPYGGSSTRKEMSIGLQVGSLGMPILPVEGSLTLHSRGENHEGARGGWIGVVTPTIWGGPHRFTAGMKISSGPQVGQYAASPLPSGRSPTLQSGRQNQQWATPGRIGYVTAAVSAVSNSSQRETKLAVAHMWAGWPHEAYHLGGPQRFRVGNKMGRGPQVRGIEYIPLLFEVPESFRAGNKN